MGAGRRRHLSQGRETVRPPAKTVRAVGEARHEQRRVDTPFHLHLSSAIVRRVKTFELVLLLPFLVAFGVAGHALLSRVVKVVLWAWQPLATGELEVASYERKVYHTGVRHMLEVVVLAAVAGFVGWLALATGSFWLWVGAGMVLAGALMLDLLRWERVSVSANNLWFQRGLRSTVRQVALENIRDVTVQESEAGLLTLRHGRRGRLVRLAVRMSDKRVVALPKTDAAGGRAAVEAVGNQLRMQLAQLRAREASRSASGGASPPSPGDAELRRALRRLRRGVASPQATSS
jgi:hypothetical protein